MARRPEPIFLARATYRRRRLIDAVRFLPVVGALVFLAPILGANGDADGAGALRSTALGGLYLFGAWAVLILGAGLLVRGLSRGPGGVGADPLEPSDRGDGGQDEGRG